MSIFTLFCKQTQWEPTCRAAAGSAAVAHPVGGRFVHRLCAMASCRRQSPGLAVSPNLSAHAPRHLRMTRRATIPSTGWACLPSSKSSAQRLATWGQRRSAVSATRFRRRSTLGPTGTTSTHPGRACRRDAQAAYNSPIMARDRCPGLRQRQRSVWGSTPHRASLRARRLDVQRCDFCP